MIEEDRAGFENTTRKTFRRELSKEKVYLQPNSGDIFDQDRGSIVTSLFYLATSEFARDGKSFYALFDKSNTRKN